jgi:hypothetical protein
VEDRVEDPAVDCGGVSGVFLAADGVGAFHRRADGSAASGEMVRARARLAVPGASLFYRRGDRGVYKSGVGDEVSGAKANKVLAYGVASVSGSILAVCSCTVLPLFAGILGPATAFLYSGPAINVLAIVLTARILGAELGIARAVGAIGFSVVIGLAMHLIYRKEELEKANGQMGMPEPEVKRPLWQNAVFFFVMVGVLVFANWGAPGTWDYTGEDGVTVRVDIVEAPFDPEVEGAAFKVAVNSSCWTSPSQLRHSLAEPDLGLVPSAEAERVTVVASADRGAHLIRVPL